MKLERIKNAKRNSIWGIINRLFSILFPFVIRTVIIKVLGVEYLGLNNLYTSILSVLSLTELGFGTAIVFSLYKPIAEDDCVTICALMNLYKKIYRIIGLIVLLIGLGLMPFLPYLINGDIPDDINLYLLYLIYLGNSVVSYWLFAYKNCLLNAHQRDDIISKVTVSINFFMYSCQIIILLLLRNYYCYIIVIPIFSILINLTNAFFASKLFPQYNCYGKVSPGLIKDLKKRVGGLMISKLTYVSRNSIDSIILSAFLGLTFVATYNNYFYIITAVSGILMVLTNAIAAGIGNSMVTESLQKNLMDMRKFNFIFMWIVGVCLSCLLSLYQPFMKLWVGEELMLSNFLMFMFALYFLVMHLRSIIMEYFDALGLWWHRKWYTLLEAVSNLILNIVLVQIWGMNGVLFATIFTTLFFDFFSIAYLTFKFYFKKGFKSYMLEQMLYFFVCIIVSCINYTVCSFIPCNGDILRQILLLTTRLLICIILPNLLFFCGYFKLHIFQYTKNWIKTSILLRK